jgi:hypothetical protein
MEGSAQTVITVTPNSVDPVKPQQVTLQIKTNGASDLALVGQVQSVNVSDKPAADLKKEGDVIKITPPSLDPGPKILQLLDSAKNVLATGELVYKSESKGGDNRSQTLEEQRSQSAEARRDALTKYTWYYLLVTGMFLAVLVPFVLAIYRGTSGSASTNNRPLGLPVGSFRSILAYSLVAYLGFYILTSILSVSTFPPPDFLLGIVATVIGFYFGSRTGEEGEASEKTGIVRGSVRQGTNPARGAIIKFKRTDDGKEPYSRISDVDGRFELRGAKPGKYKVSASLTGSTPSDEQEVAVAEGSDHEIELVIKAAAPPAPQTGTVQGAVTKPSGDAAPQATVTLSQGGVKKFEKTADATGKYKIDAVPVGDYDVEALLAGNANSDKVKVTITANGQHNVALQLK